MSAPTTSPSKPRTRRRRVLAGTIAIIVLIVVLVPPLLASGFTIPVSKVTFNETTGSLAFASANATVQVMTAYQWLFTVRTGGMIQTSNTDVSSSRGTVNITVRLELTNPSNQVVDLGNTTINGAIGTRSHTLYLSVDQGVRVAGTYKLDIIVEADVNPVGGPIQLALTKTVTVNFTIS